MYQIVVVSEFARKLRESTHATPACERAEPAAEPTSPRRIPGARAPRAFEALAALAAGVAFRILGAR